MDCLLDYRSHIGNLIPLVPAWNTGRGSSVTVHSDFAPVCRAIDDGKKDEENSFMKGKASG